MPGFSNLPIMPKQDRAPSTHASPTLSFPYPVLLSSSTSTQRNAAVWTSSDDEILLQARASGLNWQPIASKHFPNKTANACRKRHERLMERRHAEDWDAGRLERLAQEYTACRKEMWEIVAARLGERWTVVEAKCMEKGLKTLQATTRTAQRKASVSSVHPIPEQGVLDHNSDSGIGLASLPSDTEMETIGEPTIGHTKSASWHAEADCATVQQRDHSRRSYSLPQPLPLYRPPPPIATSRRLGDGNSMGLMPQPMNFGRAASSGRSSPDSNVRNGISIQAVLSPAEPSRS